MKKLALYTLFLITGIVTKAQDRGLLEYSEYGKHNDVRELFETIAQAKDHAFLTVTGATFQDIWGTHLATNFPGKSLDEMYANHEVRPITADDIRNSSIGYLNSRDAYDWMDGRRKTNNQPYPGEMGLFIYGRLVGSMHCWNPFDQGLPPMEFKENQQGEARREKIKTSYASYGGDPSKVIVSSSSSSSSNNVGTTYNNDEVRRLREEIVELKYEMRSSQFSQPVKKERRPLTFVETAGASFLGSFAANMAERLIFGGFRRNNQFGYGNYNFRRTSFGGREFGGGFRGGPYQGGSGFSPFDPYIDTRRFTSGVYSGPGFNFRSGSSYNFDADDYYSRRMYSRGFNFR